MWTIVIKIVQFTPNSSNKAEKKWNQILQNSEFLHLARFMLHSLKATTLIKFLCTSDCLIQSHMTFSLCQFYQMLIRIHHHNGEDFCFCQYYYFSFYYYYFFSPQKIISDFHQTWSVYSPIWVLQFSLGQMTLTYFSRSQGHLKVKFWKCYLRI